jgi:hypothetical protein
MGVITFTITGSQAAVETLRDELAGDAALPHGEALSLSGVHPALSTTALRRPLGLEPLVYFTVVFSAHLAADFTAHAVRTWLRDRASRSVARIEVEETEGEEGKS